jgi:hypothetical protein
MLVVVAQKVPALTGSHCRRVPACASLNEVTFAVAPQTRFCFAMANLTPTRTIPQPSAEVAVAEEVVRLIVALYYRRPYATSAAVVCYLASWGKSQGYCAAGVGSGAGASMADAFATRVRNCPRSRCRRRCLAERWKPSAALDDSCWLCAAEVPRKQTLAKLEATAMLRILMFGRHNRSTG